MVPGSRPELALYLASMVMVVVYGGDRGGEGFGWSQDISTAGSCLSKLAQLFCFLPGAWVQVIWYRKPSTDTNQATI